MNLWLFLGLFLFGWSTLPIQDFGQHRASAKGYATMNLITLTVGSLLIACVLS